MMLGYGKERDRGGKSVGLTLITVLGMPSGDCCWDGCCE